MATVNYHEEIGTGSGSLDDGPGGEDERVFIVRTDLPSKSKFPIYIHPKTPKVYERHPRMPLLFCRRVHVDRMTSRTFIVSGEYSSSDVTDEKQRNENPLARPPKIEFHSAQGRRLAITDVNGDVMRNTAGDPLAAEDVDEPAWVISFLKNVAKVPSWVTTYVNAINKDTVRIRGLTFAPETLKLQVLDIPDFRIENGKRFLPLGFKLHYRRRKWRMERLNEGFYELVPKTVTRNKFVQGFGVIPVDVEIIDREQIFVKGMPAVEPVALDKNSRQFRDADGELLDPIPLKKLVMIEFDMHEKKAFRRLPLK